MVLEERNRSPATDKFTIFEYKYGATISGPCPTFIVLALLRAYKEEYGYDIVDGEVAAKLGVAFALTNREKSNRWREELREIPIEWQNDK